MPDYYAPQTWFNGPTGGTPVSAARLNHMEAGINAVDSAVQAVEAAVAAIDASDLEANGSYAAPSTVVMRTRVTADPEPRWVLHAGGLQEWGDGTAAVDTNLYRLLPSQLKTDSIFISASDIYARAGGATQVFVGNAGPSGQSGISFQNGEAGANLYRVSVAAVKTDGAFAAGSGIYARHNQASMTIIGDIGPGGESGVMFGASADTNLYRASANVLKTDSVVYVAGDLYAALGSGQVRIGAAGPGSQSGISFQAGEIVVYRVSSGTLQTSSNFIFDGFSASKDVVVAKYMFAAETRMGAQGPSSEAGITFGIAGDTNLYRSAADTLKTDDAFTVAGDLGAVSDVALYRSPPGPAVYAVNSDLRFSSYVGTVRVDTVDASQISFAVRGAASQAGNLQEWQSSTPATLFAIDPAGLPKWVAAANQQTTVGAAGGASALPATPTKYLKVKDSAGTTLVIPAYAP